MTTVIVAIVATSPRGRSTGGTLFPWLRSAVLAAVAAAAAAVAVVLDGSSRWTAIAASHFVEEAVELVLGAADPALRTVSIAVVVAPRLSVLALRTIASHVTGLSTDATDDAGREILLLRAIVFTMTNLTAVLAGLVLVVTESTVESGELTKLVPLKFVLAFGDRGSLGTVSDCAICGWMANTYRLNDIVDQLLRLVHFILGVGHDQAMQVFFLVAGVSCVRTTLALFDGALATDRDLRAGLRLHLLERIASRADK
jgi:hypothetical protein